MKIALIIPALNEEACIGEVVREVRAVFKGQVIVVDNGSEDETAARAEEAGATVVRELRRGYGRACRAGIAAAPASEAYLFMDGDGCDRAEDIPRLVDALENGADVALAVRRGAAVEPGSITLASRFGNWLSGWLIGLAWGTRIHDLSPLKAIRRSAMERLKMQEESYGWTLELIARAVALRMQIVEIDTGYGLRRGGESKVSGNFKTSAKAGLRILATLGRVWLRSLRPRTLGMTAGIIVALCLLGAFTAMLATAAPSSGGIIAATLLAAWPILLIGASTGLAAGWLLERNQKTADA